MRVLFFEQSYSRQLNKFLCRVWNKDLTESEVAEKRQREMAGNPYTDESGWPIAIAVQNDQVIGHHAGIPMHLWANGREAPGYWLAGLYVLPEGRRQGVAKALQKATNQLPLKTSFWVVEATLRVKNSLGWTVVGKIPEYIKVFDPEKLAESIDFTRLQQFQNDRLKAISKLFSNKNSVGAIIFQSVFKAQNSVFEAFLSRRSMHYKICQVRNFDNRIDHLWDRNKNRLKLAQVRRSGYLNWQFSHESGWIKIIAEADSRVAGYAILCLKDVGEIKYINGLRVLSIIDIFWDFTKPEVFWDLLQYIERMGRENNVTVQVCSINNKKAGNILLRNGYIRIPGTVYFGFHCNDSNLPLSPNMADWFVTRGDADAAGSLGPNKKAGRRNI